MQKLDLLTRRPVRNNGKKKKSNTSKFPSLRSSRGGRITKVYGPFLWTWSTISDSQLFYCLLKSRLLLQLFFLVTQELLKPMVLCCRSVCEISLTSTHCLHFSDLTKWEIIEKSAQWEALIGRDNRAEVTHIVRCSFWQEDVITRKTCQRFKCKWSTVEMVQTVDSVVFLSS